MRSIREELPIFQIKARNAPVLRSTDQPRFDLFAGHEGSVCNLRKHIYPTMLPFYNNTRSVATESIALTKVLYVTVYT